MSNSQTCKGVFQNKNPDLAKPKGNNPENGRFFPLRKKKVKDQLSIIINKSIEFIKYEIYMVFSEAIQYQIIETMKFDPIN